MTTLLSALNHPVSFALNNEVIMPETSLLSGYKLNSSGKYRIVFIPKGRRKVLYGYRNEGGPQGNLILLRINPTTSITITRLGFRAAPLFPSEVLLLGVCSS